MIFFIKSITSKSLQERIYKNYEVLNTDKSIFEWAKDQLNGKEYNEYLERIRQKYETIYDVEYFLNEFKKLNFFEKYLILTRNDRIYIGKNKTPFSWFDFFNTNQLLNPITTYIYSSSSYKIESPKMYCSVSKEKWKQMFHIDYPFKLDDLKKRYKNRLLEVSRKIFFYVRRYSSIRNRVRPF